MTDQFSRYWRGLCMLLGAALLLAGTAAKATAQAIWFAPLSGPQGPPDYMALFHADAPWQYAAAHVKVFEISYALVFNATDADLKTIFADLERRHIELMVGVAPLSGPGPGNCGYHVESYGAHGTPYVLARKLKALGAKPVYFGMDEPLYFGHVYEGQPANIACHSSIPDLATDVADSVRQLRTFFPGVAVGDVEPLSFDGRWFEDGAWLHDIGQWADAYQSAVGDRLAFFRLDMWWGMQWQQHMATLTQLLHKKGVPLQVIYDGYGSDRTDAAWISHAVAAFKAFESGPWPRPDAVSIQFWDPHPSRVLPESDPLSATGLIDRYLEWQKTGN